MWHVVDFAIHSEHSEIKRKWKDKQILEPCKRTKKNSGIQVIVGGALAMVSKDLEKTEEESTSFKPQHC